jgi:hypothetical protein
MKSTDLEARYILDEHVARLGILGSEVRQDVIDQMKK